MQAAADELRLIPVSLRPKDVVDAVVKALDKDRAVRASMRPPSDSPNPADDNIAERP